MGSLTPLARHTDPEPDPYVDFESDEVLAAHLMDYEIVYDDDDSDSQEESAPPNDYTPQPQPCADACRTALVAKFRDWISSQCSRHRAGEFALDDKAKVALKEAYITCCVEPNQWQATIEREQDDRTRECLRGRLLRAE